MTSNVEQMLNNLEPVIVEKCEQLQNIRKEKILSRLFIVLCVMILLIPALLIFLGLSLAALIVPLLFMSLSIIMLMPVLLSQKSISQGGVAYE